jgi:hypothetical protein
LAEIARSGADIRVAHLMSAPGSHSLSYEAVFHWKDSWLPLHGRVPEPPYRRSLPRPEEQSSRRALVHELRGKSINLFAERGAASNQIGRARIPISICCTMKCASC